MSEAPATPVIITRTTPGVHASAARVAKLGLRPILSPALTLSPLPQPGLDEAVERSAGLIFTSANGVAYFADASPRRDIAAWCVGPSTAAAARETGFAEVHASSGDGAALADFIATHASPGNGALLHIANEAARGDVKVRLEQAGFSIEFMALYRTATADALTKAAITALNAPSPCILLVHSAKGAKAFKVLSGEQWGELHVVAISPQAAAAFEDTSVASLHAADHPDEDDLMRVLENTACSL